MNRNWFVFFGFLVFVSFAHAQAIQVSNVNVDPNPVIPGQFFTIYATVTNAAGANANDVVVNLDLRPNNALTTYPFFLPLVDSPLRNIGALPSFQSAQVQYRVLVDSQAVDGMYAVSLGASQRNQSGGKLEFTIQVVNRKPVLSIISVSPTEVRVGQSQVLELMIRNISSSPARDITIGVSEERTVTSTGVVVERDIIPLGAAFVYLPELDADDSASINLSLLISPTASSKASFVPIKMSFYDSNKTLHAQTDYIGLKVSAEPELGVSVAEYSVPPVSGKVGKVIVDMFNTGLGAAKFLSVQVKADWIDLSKKDFFIGTVESDDFDSITLEGKVSDSVSPGMQTAVVTLTYQNAFGDVQTVEKSVPVRIFSTSEVATQNGNGFPLVQVIIVILVVVGIWYFRFRKPVNGNGKSK